MQPVFRFAPSPNGYLHLGHAFSVLANADFACRMSGRFLVRIEDIDTQRCREELVAVCMEDLAWLGLEWETPVLRQSEHFERYRAVATGLEARGLAYPCFCTRNDIAQESEKNQAAGANRLCDPDGAPIYPGTCRHLDAATRAARIVGGMPHTLRLDMAAALRALGGTSRHWDEASSDTLEMIITLKASPENWGDVILVRKECPTSYHLSVVLDDALQGITHVVRGADLYEATAVHRVLQELIGLPAPRYHHHALMTDDAGKKLAKSAASKPLRALRAEGLTAQDIRRQLGFT